MNVSLVIPTLNNEKTLGKCLESLKKQLTRGDEFIVVDSYSKDNTLKIAKKYKCRVIKTRGNRSKARNLGWKKSKNEVIVFVESDSIYKSDYIKVVKKVFSNKKVDCILDKRLHYKPKSWVSKVLNKEFQIRYAGDFKPVTAWVYRKKVLESVGGFDERLEYAEDVDIGTRVKKKGYKILFEPRLVQYHLGEPKTFKEVIKRSWKFGQNMKPYYKKHKKTPYFKIILFSIGTGFIPLIFLINIIRYKRLNLKHKILLSFLSVSRNVSFSMSYILHNITSPAL